MSDSLWPHGLWPARLLHPWDFPGKNTGVGCQFLLQGIFPTQGLNPCLLHCRWILYQLSSQGTWKIPWNRGAWWAQFMGSQRDRHDRVTKNCQYLMFRKIVKIYSGYQYNFSPLQIILYPFSCDCQGFIASEKHIVLICSHPTTSWTPLFCYPHGHWKAKHWCEQTGMKANTR